MVRRAVQRTLLAAIVVLAAILFMAPNVANAAENRATERPGSLTPNQMFGGGGLTVREALAACGPAAAVAFANAVGRPVSLDRAVTVARTVGWTPAHGMRGPHSEVALLQRLNVPVTLEAGLNAARIKNELLAGRPVIIRTGGRGSGLPGHYFVAERIDPSTGRLDLAQSALVLRRSGGRRWYGLGEISSLGTGTPTHVIYLASGGSKSALATAAATSFAPIASGPQSAAPGSHVVATGGSGARLRAAPGVGSAIVGTVVDGTRIADTGATAIVAGRTWKQVTVAGGRAVWIDSGLLRAA